MTTAEGQNYMLSESKIEPLKSPVKYHQWGHDSMGVIGEDWDIQETHEQPLHSDLKHHHVQAPHADSQGVVGREDIIQSTKIEPMKKQMFERTEHTHGLDDETIDAARIKPMGEVRDNFLGEPASHK